MMQSVVGLLNGEQGAVPGKSVAGLVKIWIRQLLVFITFRVKGLGGNQNLVL